MAIVALLPAFLADGVLHGTRYIKIVARGWCGASIAEGEGTFFVPSWAFDGRAKLNETEVCPKCGHALRTLAEPPLP